MSEEKNLREKNTRKLPVKKRYIFSFLAIVGIILLGYFIYDLTSYQSTDDAYVETTTVSVSPKVAGEVVRVLVKDNQQVKAGDVVAVIDQRDYKIKLDSLDKPRLFFKFRKTFDSRNRYYLVLLRNAEDKANYNYIRDIALPRVTRLLFVKFRDESTKAIYIYVKPVIWIKNRNSKEEPKEYYRINIEPDKNEQTAKRKYREGQEKFRKKILSRYPYCVVTKVTDPDLLIACHIKHHSRCNQKEKYDKWNGFSMTPTIHTLFDIGYLTFNEQGEMILSDFLRNMDRIKLHFNCKIRVDLDPHSLPYLKWHNDNVFRKANIPNFS